MAILIFLMVVAVAFTWLVVRSIRAGYGRGIFWLAWFLLGLSLSLAWFDAASLTDRALAQLWGYSLIGLPVWWAIKALRRANRRG